MNNKDYTVNGLTFSAPCDIDVEYHEKCDGVREHLRVVCARGEYMVVGSEMSPGLVMFTVGLGGIGMVDMTKGTLDLSTTSRETLEGWINAAELLLSY